MSTGYAEKKAEKLLPSKDLQSYSILHDLVLHSMAGTIILTGDNAVTPPFTNCRAWVTYVLCHVVTASLSTPTTFVVGNLREVS